MCRIIQWVLLVKRRPLQDCRLIHKALDGDKVEFTCEAGIDFVCGDRKNVKEQYAERWLYLSKMIR